MNPKETRVLLIEADSDDAEAVRRQLLDAVGGAFELTIAARLSAACHLLARDAYDVVLLDLVLPHTVGIEGCRKIRAQSPRTPVIVLAGFHDEGLAAEAVAAGAQDYVIKGTQDFCCLRRTIRH